MEEQLLQIFKKQFPVDEEADLDDAGSVGEGIKIPRENVPQIK